MNFHQHYRSSSNRFPDSNNSRFSLSTDANSVLLNGSGPHALRRDEALEYEDSDLERTVMFATDNLIVLRGLTMNFDDHGWKCSHCSSIDGLTGPLAKGAIEVIVVCESVLNDKEDLGRLQAIVKHNPLTAVIGLVENADSDAAKVLEELAVSKIFTMPFDPRVVLLSAYDAVAEFFGDSLL